MNTDELHARLNKLEILFSEQEYTVESLNAVVTRQAQDIDKLHVKINLLKHQIKEFKKNIPETAILDERPPHY